MNTTLSQDQVDHIVHADHHDPFEVLGAHIITLGGIDKIQPYLDAAKIR